MELDDRCEGCSRYVTDARLLPFHKVGNAFKAIDIATPIGIVQKGYTFSEAMIEAAEGVADGRDEWFMLVKDGERTVGWLQLEEDFENGNPQVDPIIPIIPVPIGQVVPSSTSLFDLLPLLEKHCVLLVLTGNQITHDVTFGDFDKIQGHIWLYSLFAELESAMMISLNKMIAMGTKPLKWLSEGRLAKAHSVYALRYPHRHVEEASDYELVTSTTLIDKVTMITKDPEMVAELDVSSSGDTAKFLVRVERTRNEVAHGTSLLNSIHTAGELLQMVTQIEQMVSALLEFAST